MEEDKVAAESDLTHSQATSTKRKRSWKKSTHDLAVQESNRSKAAERKFSKSHTEGSRWCIGDGNKQIKCCFVVLKQHRNKVNLETSHVKDNGHKADQDGTDRDETCIIQHEEMLEDEPTDTNTYQVKQLTRQCGLAVSKMRAILKRGPTSQDDSNPNPIVQVGELQKDHLCTLPISSQFNAKKIRQYDARSKRKKRCQSDIDTSVGIMRQMQVGTATRQEQIVAGQENLPNHPIRCPKPTRHRKLTSTIPTDKWTFSKDEIEEQEKEHCHIDTMQIDEGMYDVLGPDEPNEEMHGVPDEPKNKASAHNTHVGRPHQRQSLGTERLSTLAASNRKGSTVGSKGERSHPVSVINAAGEAELVFRFWPEDAQEQYRKDKALSYLDDVKTAYRQLPQIYNKFVDLVRSLKVTKKPTKDIRQEVCNLFEDNAHLITGFNMFLPPDTTQEIHDGTGVAEGYLTKFQNKLVTKNVDQPTVKGPPGPVTESTIQSVGKATAHLLKETLAYPEARTPVNNTSKIINSPCTNAKKSHPEKIRNISCKATEEQMRSILNVPTVHPVKKSMINTSEISRDCPKEHVTIHPKAYKVNAISAVALEQYISLCNEDSVASAVSTPMDNSVLESDPLSTNLTRHPETETFYVSGTSPVKEGSNPRSEGIKVLDAAVSRVKPGAITVPITPPVCVVPTQSVRTAGGLHRTEKHSKGLHESKQFPKATKEGISQPSLQFTNHPTEMDETVTDTTHQSKAKAVIQKVSHDDIYQGTETYSQTEILIGSEAETETEKGLGTEGKSHNKRLVGIEEASQTTKETVIEKQSRSEVQSHTETHQQKAMSYLNDVKTAHMQSPQIYNKFVDLVRSLKDTTKSTKHIRHEISKLFEGNPHLINGFNMFLPPDTAQEIPDEAAVTKGCLTNSHETLVTQHVNQSGGTSGPVTDSTVHSVGESPSLLVKDTLAALAGGNMAKNASIIVNSPWMDPKESHSEEISKVRSRTIDEQIRSILNIPIVYPERKSIKNASEISRVCPADEGSIHPTEYAVDVAPPMPTAQSHSRNDVDSVACTISKSTDSSGSDSNPLSRSLTNRSVRDAMSVDGTHPVKEGTRPFVLKFPNEGAAVQEGPSVLRDAVRTYTSSFPHFPHAAAVGGVPPPSGQPGSPPAARGQPLGSPPTTQLLSHTTHQVDVGRQQAGHGDTMQGAPAQVQTERWTECEAQSATEKGAYDKHMGPTSQTTNVSMRGNSHTGDNTGTELEPQTDNQVITEVESHTENHLAIKAASLTEKLVGTEREARAERHQGTEAESQIESYVGMEAETQTKERSGSIVTSQTERQWVVEVEPRTESGKGEHAVLQTENHVRAQTERETKCAQRTLLPSAEHLSSQIESQTEDPIYVDEKKALTYVLETSERVTRQMVRQMESEAKSTQVLTGERSVNKVTLLGRVGRPAEMRGTADYPVTVFPLATSISIKRDDGTYEQQTEWHRISIFRKGLRDIAAASITTGDRVYVSGSIKYGSFEQDGRTVYSTSIVADDVIRLTAKAAAQSSPGTSEME